MLNLKITDNKIYYPCGCTFDVVPGSNPVRLIFDPRIENLPLDCSLTWDLMSSGNTKGVFQLESRFGQQYAKKLKPRNMEHLAALAAILRPGCISKDANISIRHYIHKDGRIRWVKMNISELYENFQKTKAPDNILSYDADNHSIIYNKLHNVIYNGKKDVFRVKYRRQYWPSRTNDRTELKCTACHPLLVLGKGWTKLEDMKIGDRFATITKKSNKTAGFKQTCFESYQYKCIFCDWDEGSLDVNHIDGNRRTNNDADNLCFLCPNHHRMYSEQTISRDSILQILPTLRLAYHENICWSIYEGMEFIGEEDVFDLSMDAPHHNFIADNVVVHNCSNAIRDGKSVTDHYIDRKNGLEPVTYFHEALEGILGTTYGEMIYQEQAMKIAQEFAGFTLEQADSLRKAIGKKLAALMAEVKIEFLAGCAKVGILTVEQAEELFGWIEKSQRYSFNKSHAVSYAYNSYLSAYGKAHFPVSYFTSYLFFSKDKQGTFDEIKLLVGNAKLMGINISPPDFRRTNAHFKRLSEQLTRNDVYNPYDDTIYFGFADIKDVGESSIQKISTAIFQVETILGKERKDWTWAEFLVFFSQEIGSRAIIAMIEAGAMDYLKISRKRMIYEYERYSTLTDKEQAWIKQNVKLRPEFQLKDILQQTFDWYNAPQDKKTTDKRPYHTANKLEKAKNEFNLLINPPYSLNDSPEWKVSVEEARLGLALTTSILDSCIDVSEANTTCLAFINKSECKNMFIAAQIDEMKTHMTEAGEEMLFITISDNDASLDAVIFPKDWTEIKTQGVCIKGNTVMVNGMRSNRDSLIIKNMWQLN